MASSNKTDYLRLSQFERVDDPSWYDDYNVDMQKVDEYAGATRFDLDSAKAELVDVNTSLVAAKAELNAAKQELGVLRTSLDEHRGDKQNPHSVTAAQVGAASAAELGVLSGNLAAHIGSNTNPHSVTAAQTGAYSKAEVDTLLEGKTNYFIPTMRSVKPDTGYTGSIVYCKTLSEIVFVEVSISRSDGKMLDGTAPKIGAIPLGFRPEVKHWSSPGLIIAKNGVAQSNGCRLTIRHDGTLWFYFSPYPDTTNCYQFTAQVTFPVCAPKL